MRDFLEILLNTYTPSGSEGPGFMKLLKALFWTVLIIWGINRLCS